MDLEKSRQDFAKLQRKITTYNYAMDLMYFDGETAAPASAASNRIATLEILNDELYSLKLGDETAELMAFLLENEDQLSLVERRSLEVLKREFDRTKSITKEGFIKYQSLLSATRDAWHLANEENDYEILRPHLEKVFDSVRDLASAYNPDMKPYDYCLDRYEPGSNENFYDGVFEGVRRDVVPLLREIMEKPQVDDSCLKGDYSVEKQETLARYIMELMGVDMTKVALSTSEHPFTRRMGSHFDERITTRYSRSDFTFSLYTILFGCGFALTETGQDDELAYTLADGSASIGIMEGQTRFYEHIIGRSLPFMEHIYPKLKSLFPTSIKDSSPEDLYLAVNKVSAGPIRIGSDEVTNNLHILVRYELEKALMNRDLSFADLPDAWAEKYRDYLGVEVKDHAKGVLQDVLWADAAIGYFPTAVLGNAYSALMLAKMIEDVDIEGCIREGNIGCINDWNREHVWKHIGLHDAYTVMGKFVGSPFIDSEAYIKYLRAKFTGIYNL